MKTCKICNQSKELTEFNPCGKYKDTIHYRGECKEYNKLKQRSDKTAQKKYRATDHYRNIRNTYKKTEKYRIWARNYDNNVRKDKRRKYTQNKLDNDQMYRMRHYLRARLYDALKKKSWYKTTHFSNYIGCTLEELIKHMESKFTSGMSWENQGEWHIDHIIPLSSASTPEELYKLCHYTNLQPLWAKDNLQKSDKLS